ncbi:ATP-binding protein [Glutamicibacter sp. AOP5-A2-18]|uniref:ATP-binding protein n=1 Tax=Glutamicibacter sp. AOP5-A2-18 TaxID=3457656 RepID=UPI0040344BA5
MGVADGENLFESLIRRLTAMPAESEWVEFKENLADEQAIAEYISALGNAAAVVGEESAYMVWGVEDGSHRLVGTSFDPRIAKKGNEGLENWLQRTLQTNVDFRFEVGSVDGKSLVVLLIKPAASAPIRAGDTAWIRVGSQKKKLKDFPQKEAALWRSFDSKPVERRIAMDSLRVEDVLRLLDYPAYFTLLDIPLPTGPELILNSLENDKMIRLAANGTWSITNLGALLFARDMSAFPDLSRKAFRVIRYVGRDRLETEREQVGSRGYAAGFDGLIGYLDTLLPAKESLESPRRQDGHSFPKLAIRELVANALIHQDLALRGSGPMIEIFDDRVEISNPGRPLIDPLRFVDTAPHSRNEALASFLRRIGVCEERGTGWDKVAALVEINELPAPSVRIDDIATRVTVFSHRPLSTLSKSERSEAVYLHACLRYVRHEQLNNASLRERFRIDKKNSAQASRLIRDAVEVGLIVAFDPDAGHKGMRYVPFWSVQRS